MLNESLEGQPFQTQDPSNMQIEDNKENQQQCCAAQMHPNKAVQLKQKQTQNILQKIQNLLTKVDPIHQTYGEDSDSDMASLIEEMTEMDIQENVQMESVAKEQNYYLC